MNQSKTSRKISSSDKAALMLLSLGKQTAAEVMKHLSEHEAKRVSRLLLGLQEISRSDQLAVLHEFHRLLSASDKLLIDGKSFARELIEDTFGKEAALEMAENGRSGTSESLRNILGDIPNEVLRDVVLKEHPQTVAYLLAHMHPDQGADILGSLSDDEQTDTLLRISQLAQVSEAIADEVREVLRKEVSVSKSMNSNIEGKKVAAELLSRMSHLNEERLLSEMEELNPELADEVRELMFTFEDLRKLDAKSIQAVLKEVPRDTLVLSFKLASKELQELFLANVSSRAADMIMEDFEALPPTKKKDVEAAQQAIIDVVRRLEAEGKVALSDSDSDGWV